MLAIFNTLQIVNLGGMIMIINTIRVIIIFTIAKKTTTITVDYKEENIIFMAKKFVALTNIWMMSSRK